MLSSGDRRSRMPSRPPHRTGLRQMADASSLPSSVSPSPSWKDALRRGCLQRARKRREDTVSRARRLRSPHLGDVGADVVPPPSVPSDAARDLVREEMVASGVAVARPTAAAAPSSRPGAPAPLVPLPGQAGGGFFTPTPDMTEAQHVQESGSPPAGEITEEEMHALIREVEEELRREEALLAEEVLTIERQQCEEDMAAEEQIADYERWHQNDGAREGSAPTPTNTPATPGDQKFSAEPPVPCPVCGAGYLIRTCAGVIFCPNAVATGNAVAVGASAGRMQQCNLRLDVSSEGLTLSHLREQLQRAYEEHGGAAAVGGGGCPGQLAFRLSEQFGATTLSASCDVCRASAIII